MRHTVHLPASLGNSFHVREAVAAGIGIDRCRARDLHRPFLGVRSISEPETFEDLVKAYAGRMKQGHRLCGPSALRAWGLPVDGKFDAAIEVCVLPDTAPPRSRGVKGRRMRADRARTATWHGVPIIDPVAALFTSARALTVTQAATIMDALLTDADNYPGLRGRRPLATHDEIGRRLEKWGRFPGCGVLRAALDLARDKVESPKETETRLMLLDAGLPEPVVQFEALDNGRFMARVDLAYPELKIAIEYEGDGHRVDRDQWRRDIARQRDLEDHGWIVIRLTQHDLEEGRDAVLLRIRNAIAARVAN